jgi:TolB-like protein/DNA-binding winged helix-turn-helix (wHTH) protein/Tfp pilus assembly protein PilF
MESLTQPRKGLPDDDSAVQFFRFGVFEVDPRTGELRRQGRKIKLQKKSLQLLLLLIERAGEVVLRDELRAGLWPADTFVDFDSNIKTALNRLRQSLGDSAENPVFIETIPKTGWRFIAPVTKVERTAVSPTADVEPGTIDSRLSVESISSRLPTRSWKLAAVSAALLVVAVVGLLLLLWRNRTLPSSSPRSLVLLVLPFDNLSGDPTQDFFSDGVTDEMITALGENAPQGLSVIARTSAMQYRATRKPLVQIARELGGADYVLEGSVRRAGDHVAVNVQLLRVSDQAVLWADTYQREVADLVAVQEDVAQRVSSSIVERLTLTPRVTLPREVNPQAHDAYLMGLYYAANKRTGLNLLTSLKYFQQAIQQDPNYAAPYAGLAYSYMLAAGWEMLTPADAYPKAKAASERALELDPNLAEAHMTLATAEHEYYWKWGEAETEFRKAVELNPNSSLAHKGYAEFLMHAGRNEEALREIQRAVDLDPFSLGIRTLKALIYLFAGQRDAAAQECTRIIQLDPQSVPAYYFLGGIYAEQKRYGDAITQLEAAQRFSDGSPKMLAALGWIYAVTGRRKEARHLLSKLQHDAGHKYVSPFSLAKIYAALGDKSQAFDLLQKAVAERSSDLMYLRHDPGFDNLHDDPRFAELESKIGFPVEIRTVVKTATSAEFAHDSGDYGIS